MPTGEKVSVTQVYALQAEAERQEQNQAQGE
jgi:hypothetical protein